MTLKNVIPGFDQIKKPVGYVTYNVTDTVAAIVTHKYTVGYIPLSAVEGTGLTVIKLDGVDPSMENVRNGSYKLVTPLGLVWKGELQGLAKSFFQYLYSPEGKRIIIEKGCIPAAGQ